MRLGAVLEGVAIAAAGVGLIVATRAAGGALGTLDLPLWVGAAFGALVGGVSASRFASRVGGWAWGLMFVLALVGMLSADVARGAGRIGATLVATDPMPATDFAALDGQLAHVFGPVVGEELWVEPTTASGLRGSSRQRVTQCVLGAVGPLADGGLVWVASIRRLDVPDLAANGPRLYQRDDLEGYESCAKAASSLDPAARAAFDGSVGRRWLASDDPAERTALNDTGANASWVFGVVWAVGSLVAAVRGRR